VAQGGSCGRDVLPRLFDERDLSAAAAPSVGMTGDRGCRGERAIGAVGGLDGEDLRGGEAAGAHDEIDAGLREAALMHGDKAVDHVPRDVG